MTIEERAMELCKDFYGKAINELRTLPGEENSTELQVLPTTLMVFAMREFGEELAKLAEEYGGPIIGSSHPPSLRKRIAAAIRERLK